MECQWSRQDATFPRDIFKYCCREKELKASLEAPFEPFNLAWNRWEPHSQHCAHPSTWPPFDLLTELIFQQISFELCHELPLSISCHTCLAASLPSLCVHPAALYIQTVGTTHHTIIIPAINLFTYCGLWILLVSWLTPYRISLCLPAQIPNVNI